MRGAAHITAVLLALLAGCSRGPEGPSLQLELVQLLQHRLSAGNGDAVARPALTRAALQQINGAYIEVTLERTGALAYLGQQLQRRDDSPGGIVVWRSEDDITLALRNGVLVATRGLGDDLLSASALVGDGQPGPVVGGARRYQIRGGDADQRGLVMRCQLIDLGLDPVVIVERQYPTRHLQERCEGGGGRVVNDYWVDSGAGRVWQSRQWAGPTLGYLRLRQLTL